MAKTYLGRLALLEEMKLKSETVTLASGEVMVKELPGTDYIEVLNSPLVKDAKGEFDGSKFTSLLVARCVVDGKGVRLFADEDIDAIRNGSTSILNKLGAAVKRVNGLTGAEAKN